MAQHQMIKMKITLQFVEKDETRAIETKCDIEWRDLGHLIDMIVKEHVPKAAPLMILIEA